MAFVLILLLAAHLLCMNVSSAGPLLCIWYADRKANSTQPWARELALSLSKWTIFLLLLGGALGLALGVVSMLGGETRLVETLPLFQRKIGWGILELFCSLGWMTAYWFWLRRRPPQSFTARFLHGGLAVLSATNLLYHFPPLLTVMTKVARGDLDVSEPVTAAAFRALVYQPTVMAHTLHFWWASFAVAGIFLFWLAKKSEHAQAINQFGAGVALASTALQLPTGLWLLFVTPPQSQSKLVGGDGLITGLFLCSMVTAYLLLQNLAILALGDYDTKLPRRCGWLMIATVVMMSGTLHLLRA